MIYAVHIQNQRWVKIGYSKEEDVAVRVSQLQTGSPFQIQPLFTTYGTLVQEKALHSALRVAFGRIRIAMPPNEWYPGTNPFFQGFLEYLRYGPDAGLAYLENYNPSVNYGRKDKTDREPNIRWPSK